MGKEREEGRKGGGEGEKRKGGPIKKVAKFGRVL